MFTLKFETDNDCFKNGDGLNVEIASVLKEVANKVLNGNYHMAIDPVKGFIVDVNGNLIGEFKIKN